MQPLNDPRSKYAGKLSALTEKILNLEAGDWHYPHRLALEYLVRDPASGVESGSVSDRLKEANALNCGPFNCLVFELFRQLGDPVWKQSFLQAATTVFMEPCLSEEGAWQHPRGRFGPGYAILIDSFQEEASRVAKLAWLLREGAIEQPDSLAYTPADLEQAAIEQFQVHRAILRDAATGLWSNGRNWLPGQLSPGFWSRGHGWLMRGLVETGIYLPLEGAHRQVIGNLLIETADALLSQLGNDLVWHALPTEKSGDSPAETSGSAMIAAAFLTAVKHRLLPRDPYQEIALRVAEHLLENYLTEKGIVLSACFGPGPLISTDRYLRVKFLPGDSHGEAAFSMLAEALSQAARAPGAAEGCQNQAK